jgi:hypothetical protein
MPKGRPTISGKIKRALTGEAYAAIDHASKGGFYIRPISMALMHII